MYLTYYFLIKLKKSHNLFKNLVLNIMVKSISFEPDSNRNKKFKSLIQKCKRYQNKLERVNQMTDIVKYIEEQKLFDSKMNDLCTMLSRVWFSDMEVDIAVC